ncbi:hypothetical protein M0R45_019236 [Rubus argutus]|uniref:Uncharacterized protein n=1 Tax=Rubus argutus TaxID=59490 RepID=A0AAW1X6N3_RUBAR
MAVANCHQQLHLFFDPSQTCSIAASLSSATLFKLQLSNRRHFSRSLHQSRRCSPFTPASHPYLQTIPTVMVLSFQHRHSTPHRSISQLLTQRSSASPPFELCSLSLSDGGGGVDR